MTLDETIKYSYKNEEGKVSTHFFVDGVWDRFEYDKKIIDYGYKYAKKTEIEMQDFLKRCGFKKDL